LLAATFTSTASAAQAQVVINEWMGRNDTFIRDTDGDFSDWLEMHNSSDATIDISGWRVGIYDTWKVPQGVSIEPGGYLLLWASGKDGRRNGEYHMNFSIPAREWDPRSRAPDITLTDARGNLVHKVRAREQEEDEAHGLVSIGGGPPYLTRMRPPTPGSANLRLKQRPPWVRYPSGNSVLTSSETTFDWRQTAIDTAAEYYLDVDLEVVTKRATGNIFSRSAGMSTSLNVTGIPIRGERVYVTLWTRVGPVWLKQVNSYRTALAEQPRKDTRLPAK
jgi:hypothetical protein